LELQDGRTVGEYRGTFDFATVTKISKRLGWQNSFSDVYVTNPPLGKKRNDVIYHRAECVVWTVTPD